MGQLCHKAVCCMVCNCDEYQLLVQMNKRHPDKLMAWLAEPSNVEILNSIEDLDRKMQMIAEDEVARLETEGNNET